MLHSCFYLHDIFIAFMLLFSILYVLFLNGLGCAKLLNFVHEFFV